MGRLRRLARLKLREASAGRLDRLLVNLRERSPNRQHKAKVVLGAMLDIAVPHDAIPVNPVRATSRAHRPPTETKALRVDDLVEIRAPVRRWVNADCPSPKTGSDMADIVDLMLATGCRIGEMLALRWNDLELDTDLPTLSVTGTIKTEIGKRAYRKSTPKSEASQWTVVLPVFAAELLRVRREFATENEHARPLHRRAPDLSRPLPTLGEPRRANRNHRGRRRNVYD